MAYDIRDDRRLRQVCEVAKYYGRRLQYSVFVCDLGDRELLGLKYEAGRVMNLRVDSLVIIDLGELSGRGGECIEFLGHRPYELPDDEPLIR